MIADAYEIANGQSQSASHWHPMGDGGHVPPLLESRIIQQPLEPAEEIVELAGARRSAEDVVVNRMVQAGVFRLIDLSGVGSTTGCSGWSHIVNAAALDLAGMELRTGQ